MKNWRTRSCEPRWRKRLIQKSGTGLSGLAHRRGSAGSCGAPAETGKASKTTPAPRERNKKTKITTTARIQQQPTSEHHQLATAVRAWKEAGAQSQDAGWHGYLRYNVDSVRSLVDT